MNHRAVASIAVAAFAACSSAAACKGSVPIELSFENGSAALSLVESAKVERAIQQVKRSISFGTAQVALAVHAGEAELVPLAARPQLAAKREASVRELLSSMGIQGSAIVVHNELAHAGDLMTWKQGVAELEFTFACKGM
jgi:ribosomal protein L7Ae-like RNA K-turn-binding protein